MPISDQPGTEDQLFQEFQAWKAGQGLGGGMGFGPWAFSGEGGTGVAAGQEAGGGSATIARGSKAAGGGGGGSLMDQFSQWANSLGGDQQGNQQPQGAQWNGPTAADMYNPDMSAAAGTFGSGGQQAAGLAQGLLGSYAGPSPFAVGGVGPAALGNVAGGIANLAGAPPGVGFGLQQAGNMASAIGQGANYGALGLGSASVGAGTAGALAGAAGPGLTSLGALPSLGAAGAELAPMAGGAAAGGGGVGAAGLGAAAGGLIAAGVAAPMFFNSVSQFIGGINQADEAKFQATQNRRILQGYGTGGMERLGQDIQDKNLKDFQNMMGAAIYTKSRLGRGAASTADYSDPQVQRNIQMLLQAAGQQGPDWLAAAHAGTNEGMRWAQIPGTDPGTQMWNNIRGLPSGGTGPLPVMSPGVSGGFYHAAPVATQFYNPARNQLTPQEQQQWARTAQIYGQALPQQSFASMYGYNNGAQQQAQYSPYRQQYLASEWGGGGMPGGGKMEIMPRSIVR